MAKQEKSREQKLAEKALAFRTRQHTDNEIKAQGLQAGYYYGAKEQLEQDIEWFKNWLFDNAPHSVWEQFVDIDWREL